MTDKQINTAIAEACGWKTECTICDSPDCPTDPMPDYCADLNAMHEAESILYGRAVEIYAECLLDRTGAQKTDDRRFFCATARQRAEAFLMVLGKWEEAAK